MQGYLAAPSAVSAPSALCNQKVSLPIKACLEGKQSRANPSDSKHPEQPPERNHQTHPA